MKEIPNTQDGFVQLWLRLERTRCLLAGQYKRFCVRNVLKSWFGLRATDDMIWEVCNRASDAMYRDCPGERDRWQPIGGYDALPPPAFNPRRHRELLRAIVSVTQHIGMRKVNLKALDEAYSIAFPNSTPINVNKKGRATL